jgi:hypothetical protein
LFHGVEARRNKQTEKKKGGRENKTIPKSGNEESEPQQREQEHNKHTHKKVKILKVEENLFRNKEKLHVCHIRDEKERERAQTQ